MPRRVAWFALPFLLTVAAAVLPAQDPDQPQADKPAPAAETARLDLPTYGFSIEPPKGWGVGVAKDPKAAASFLKVAEEHDPSLPGQRITAAFSVTIEGLPRAAPLAEVAAALARKVSGKVSDDDVQLGGEPARRVLPPWPRERFGYAEHVIGLRNGYVYYVSLSLDGKGPAPEREELPAQWEQFVKSFRWIDIEPPAKHLSLQERPTVAFGGAAVLRVPAAATAMATKDPTKYLNWLVFNFRDNRSEFVIHLNLKPKPKVGDVGAKLADDLAARYHGRIGRRPTFKRTQTPAGSQWTEFFEVAGKGGQPTRERWGFYMSDDSEMMVILSFEIFPMTAPEHVPLYESATEEIIQSLRVSERGQGARPRE